jgi:DNA-binding PadR family transcriptional regulator
MKLSLEQFAALTLVQYYPKEILHSESLSPIFKELCNQGLVVGTVKEYSTHYRITNLGLTALKVRK